MLMSQMKFMLLSLNRYTLRFKTLVLISPQTRNNPSRKEFIAGFELLAICLFFFVPGAQFQSLLRDWINENSTELDSMLVSGTIEVKSYFETFSSMQKAIAENYRKWQSQGLVRTRRKRNNTCDETHLYKQHVWCHPRGINGSSKRKVSRA